MGWTSYLRSDHIECKMEKSNDKTTKQQNRCTSPLVILLSIISPLSESDIKRLALQATSLIGSTTCSSTCTGGGQHAK